MKTSKLRFAAATLAISTAVFLTGCEDDRSSGAGNSSSGDRSSNFGISGNPTFNPDTVADLVSVYFKGMDTIDEYSGHVVSTHQKSKAHALSMVKACTTGIIKRKDQQESQQHNYNAALVLAQQAAQTDAWNTRKVTYENEITRADGTHNPEAAIADALNKAYTVIDPIFGGANAASVADKVDNFKAKKTGICLENIDETWEEADDQTACDPGDANHRYKTYGEHFESDITKIVDAFENRRGTFLSKFREFFRNHMETEYTIKAADLIKPDIRSSANVESSVTAGLKEAFKEVELPIANGDVGVAFFPSYRANLATVGDDADTNREVTNFIGQYRKVIDDYNESLTAAMDAEEKRWYEANPHESFDVTVEGFDSMEDFSCASFAEFVSSGQTTHVDSLYPEMLGLIDGKVVVGASETEAAVEYHQWQDSAKTTLGTHSFNASGRILREWESSFQGDFQTPVDFSHVQSKSIDDFGTLRDAYLNTSYTSNFADGVRIFPSPKQQDFFYINGISTESRVEEYDADAGSCSFVFNSNHDTKFIPENMPDIENDFEFVQNQFYTCSCSSDGSGNISPDTCSEAENSRSINISGGDTAGISGTSTDLDIKIEDNVLIPINGTESYTFSHTKLSKPMKISIDHESKDKKTFNITASDGSSVKVIQNGSTYSVDSIFCKVTGLSKSALIDASYCKR